ncbi:MAG TPA: hypothetical protein VGF44_14180 [Terriglobales bacterium]|jgi:hypothetical protein
MRNLTKIICVLAIFLLPAWAAPKTKPADDNAIVIIFKDGHQQSFSMADISRIEFNTPGQAASSTVGVNRFIGKWTVGEGNGDTFTITLNRDGTAHKSIGATRGTWSVVDGEAHISWNDGWHDMIRKVGTKYEKVAYAPGKSYSDSSDNVTDARRADAEPI